MQGMSLPLCAFSIVCRTVPVVRSHTWSRRSAGCVEEQHRSTCSAAWPKACAQDKV